MPQKVLRFTGINRMVSEFNGTGTCEELINIRPTGSGAKIVKKKKSKFVASANYKSVVEHKFGSQENIIIVMDGTVIWVTDSGAHRQTIVSGDVSNITYAGNVLLVYLSDGTQKAFKFEDGEYSEYTVSIPSVSITVELTGFDGTVTHTATSVIDSVEKANAALSSAYSSFYNSLPHGLAGPIVVGCTFELEDGTETWSSGFAIIDPTKDNRFKTATSTGATITMHGAREAKLKFNIEGDVSGVKNIRFYSSVPVIPYEMEFVNGTYYPKKVSNSDLRLDGQNMYLQKVVSYRKTGEFLLDTGHSIAANDLMPVTAGTIYRVGDTVSYNNRFHFYNSKVNHVLQKMSYGVHTNRELPNESNEIDIRKARLYVVIDNGEKKIFVRHGSVFDVQISGTMDFVYPMGGIKQGYLETSDDNFATSRWYSIPFNDSAAYNYSCALDYVINNPMSTPPAVENVEEPHTQTVFWKDEPNAINVSAPFNPFVFPVQYSYSFGGEIKDLATSYLPISSTQIGQYPLTVFTTTGIYALEQGTGSVLYGNIVPLQPMAIEGKATSSPIGTFFISSKGLYLLSGREAANLSYVLNGDRELTIRDNDAYKKLCFDKKGNFYDFSSFVSSQDFEDFIEGAELTYDQLQNELYISKSDVNYSYVLNINTKAYHKVSKKYIGARNASRLVIEVEGDSMNVVDLHSEDSSVQPVLLQSRPFSLEAFYTHIQRLILMVDAKLETGHNLCFSVFGSDNLYDWKCIISAQKHNCILRQIRTNRAAKSYKDYVILISGTVGADTDLSDIIADYTVVSRRLG